MKKVHYFFMKIIIPVSTIKKFLGIWGGGGWRSAGSGGRGGRIFRNNYLNFKKLVNMKKIRDPLPNFFFAPVEGGPLFLGLR